MVCVLLVFSLSAFHPIFAGSADDQQRSLKITCKHSNKISLTEEMSSRRERSKDIFILDDEFEIQTCILSPNKKKIVVHAYKKDSFFKGFHDQSLFFINIDGTYKQQVEFDCPSGSVGKVFCWIRLRDVIWHADNEVQIYLESSLFNGSLSSPTRANGVDANGKKIKSKGNWILHIGNNNTLLNVMKR